MLKNYLTIAYRSLLKNKIFSFINILGLAIGMAASFLLFQYVSFQLSYDQFHKRAQDTYRVTMNIYKDGALKGQSASVSPAVASSFQRAFPGIETFTRLVIMGPDGVLSYKDRYKREPDIFLADSAFFDVFSFKLIHGNPKTALTEPFSVVITQSTAQALFNGENPVGESITINAENFDGTSLSFKVTGVVADFPENSHLRPGVLISYPTLFEFVGHRFDDSWQWNETYTYFRLHAHTDPKMLEAKFPEIVHQLNAKLLEEQHLDWQYKLQPIADIHLHSDLQHEASVNGNAFYVYFLAIVGILILVIAYVNFINLVTVKALQRAGEVGVRKIAGAYRGQLIAQFFLESILVNIVALLLSIALLQLCTPYFSNLFQVNLAFISGGHVNLWFGLAVFLVLLVFGSGFYPALILSRYKPVKVLKGHFTQDRSNATLRKSLVTAQFVIALILIAFTLAAGLQIRYMQQQSLGFSPEQIVVVRGPKAFNYGYGNNFSAFQHKTTSLAGVASVSGAGVIPGQEIYWYNDHVTLNGIEASGVFSTLPVARNYFKNFNVPIISGRSFSEPSREKWVINETAMRQLGFDTPDEAVGQKLNNGEIIGVAKDFHHESLKTAIPPILFFCGDDFNYYTIKITTNEIASTLNRIKASYTALFPGSPYDYFFLDEFFNRQYQGEQLFNTLFNLFSGLAIFIACLGLFGLTFYTATQRTKEIGIRKVLGASANSIVKLLSRDLILLVLVASLLALPIAWLAIEWWLNNYASRITMSIWLLLLPVGILALIVGVSVSFQTLKAALANPVKSLRYE